MSTHPTSILDPDHQRHVNAIAARLSLRPPQRDSLEILARVAEIVPLRKEEQDLVHALDVIRSEYATVEDFERDFPSLCFALATGVGKTRLMGAFAAYLYRTYGIRHFFVLAPNLTIYDKLIKDFTPGTPKYVFQGIAEFAQNPPLIITGENYESSLAVRGEDLFGRDERVHINVFNISKLSKDAKATKGAAPRIKRLSEYIGQSYFDYLAGLDDLVLMMDESHRYRAEAGVRVLNDLRPILGLELTATPQVEAASGAVPFKNVIYSYPLANAIRDGFVKEPAVATRENFDADVYKGREAELERLKLEDGVRLHESTKAELETYARRAGQPRVKPFMLVVAQDTTHADDLVRLIQQDSFFGGQYKDRVITVHSGKSGDEKEETIEKLLAVEDPNEPTEIVVHVNMLKEGWDVTNLYTIVPLRKANSRTLVEQSIGRGLRLPYGRKTNVPEVDRLTIVSHDHFEEIVRDANNPDSIIKRGIVIGRDVPTTKKEAVTVQPTSFQRFAITTTVPGGDGASREASPLTTPGAGDGAAASTRVRTQAEQEVANATLDVIERYRTDGKALPNAEALKRPEIRQEIVRIVRDTTRLFQPSLAGMEPASEPDVEAVVEEVIGAVVAGTISIPRVIVVPSGEVTAGFRDFDLEVSRIRYQPVPQNILVAHLQSGAQHRIATQAGVAREAQLENYVVRSLIDYQDVDYGTHAELLYKLAGQLVDHLRSYLADEGQVENVLQYYEKQLAENIHGQMQAHFEERATEYQVEVTRGFETPKPLNYTREEGEPIRDFRMPVEDKSRIRSMQFGGFKKCLYPVQKFDSDPEREFAVLLEKDPEVEKWFRPVPGQLRIHFRHDRMYEPDFVVEGTDAKYLCETKDRREITSEEVLEKKAAAETWCEHATQHEQENDGKPWHYVLIPHDDVKAHYTLKGLAGKYGS